jgi:hypothetical protein
VRVLLIAGAAATLIALGACKDVGDGKVEVVTPDVDVSNDPPDVDISADRDTITIPRIGTDTHTVVTPEVRVGRDTNRVVTPTVKRP